MVPGSHASRRPAGRRERKKLDTRRRILRAAFELFQEKGFDATTVEEISERADVGKGTVFNYFPQKAAFLVAAYQGWLDLIREDLGPPDSWKGPARTQLERVFSHLADLSVKHRVLARQVIFENMRQAHLRMTRDTEEGRGAGLEGSSNQGEVPGDPEAVRLLEDMTRDVVRRGKAAAEIRPEMDDDQAASLLAAAAFHTLLRGLMRDSSASEIKSSLASKLDIIFTGLAP